MRLFGTEALGWHLYDTALLGSIFAASILLARRISTWFGGVYAAALFALVHLQDGIFQVGQRDLLITSLLLWAYVALFKAQEVDRPVTSIMLFSTAMGITVTIKPVLLPLAFLLILLAALALSKRGKLSPAVVTAGLSGLVLPSLIAILWLISHHALGAFIALLQGLIVLHARLGHQSLGYLLTHSLSPVALLFAVWLVLQFVQKQRWTNYRVQLLCGLLGTLIAFIAQGKGYPYQRYPFLALALLLIGIEFDQALTRVGVVRALGVGGLVLGAFLLGPKYAYSTIHFSPVAPFQQALSGQLEDIAKSTTVSGKIQCIDTFGGCIGVLYDRRIVQSTGFLYDCYLYGPASDIRDVYRAQFLHALVANVPNVIVVTNQYCFGGQGFGKLEEWPLLSELLAQNYVLKSSWRSDVLQHWWNRKDEPTQFRIYTLRSNTAAL